MENWVIWKYNKDSRWIIQIRSNVPYNILLTYPAFVKSGILCICFFPLFSLRNEKYRFKMEPVLVIVPVSVIVGCGLIVKKDGFSHLDS